MAVVVEILGGKMVSASVPIISYLLSHEPAQNVLVSLASL